MHLRLTVYEDINSLFNVSVCVLFALYKIIYQSVNNIIIIVIVDKHLLHQWYFIVEGLPLFKFCSDVWWAREVAGDRIWTWIGKVSRTLESCISEGDIVGGVVSAWRWINWSLIGFYWFLFLQVCTFEMFMEVLSFVNGRGMVQYKAIFFMASLYGFSTQAILIVFSVSWSRMYFAWCSMMRCW